MLNKVMDFSCLDNLPTFNDRPNNHKNIPYPNLQIISGKSGSGKTHILIQELLTPDFLDYEELYVLSPNIHQKEYQFLKLGFEMNIDKSVLLEFFPRLNKFRINQLEEVFKIICENLSSDLKQNNVNATFTSKKEDLPTIKEMNSDIKKLFIFDDIAGDVEFREITRQFFSKGRPNNCQAIYLTQQFSEVQPKSIRENTTNLILFKTSGDSFDKVYKDMAKEVMENKNEFRILAQRIWRKKYAYVFINKVDEIITNNIFEYKNE